MEEPSQEKRSEATPPPSPRSEEEPINAGEDPSPGSATASARVSPPGVSHFISDPGPAFDREGAPPGPEPEPQAELHALPGLELGWEEETVCTLLDTQGQLLHGAIGVGQQDWLHTQADLKAIGGPLTRILNRYEPTRAAAAMGDPVALALGIGAYGVRSSRERNEVLRALAEQQEPVTGVAAPPRSGPPPAPEREDEEQWKIG